jgi:Zn-dependent protease
MRIPLPGRKIGLSVQPSFLIMAAVLGWYADAGDAALLWTLAVALSVLAHELGHAFTIVGFGSGADIVLHGFGGSTRARQGDAFKTWQRCLIQASGCIMGLTLAGLTAKAVDAHLTSSSNALFLLAAMSRVNLYFSLFNLLPVQPMDGGVLLRTILQSSLGLRGLKISHAVGLATAGLVAAGFWLVGARYNALIAALFAAGAYRSLRHSLTLTPQDEDPAFQQDFKSAQELWAGGKREEAVRRLVDLRQRAQAGLIYRAATEQLGRCLFEEKQYGAAYPLLHSLGDQLSFESRLALQTLAFQAGEYEESIKIGNRNFGERPDPFVARDIASAYAACGDPRRAVQWLKTAVRNELPDPAQEVRSRDFDAIRDDPDFEELERSLSGGPGS